MDKEHLYRWRKFYLSKIESLKSENHEYKIFFKALFSASFIGLLCSRLKMIALESLLFKKQGKPAKSKM